MKFHKEVNQIVQQVPRDCILRTPREVHSALQDLIKRNCNVTIAFEGNTQLYASMVIRSNREGGFFILDGLAPSSGDQHAMALESFTFRANLQGVEIIALNNVISGHGKHEGRTIYKVPFPTELVYMQRRNAFRVYMRRGMKAEAQMRTAGRPEPVIAEVLDLSATGMKVRVTGMLDPPAQKNEVFHRCYVQVPSMGDFECRAVMRHASFHRQQQVTMCGIEFQELDGRTSQRIAMLVNEIERANRREDARLV